jgi:alcohol dehydrogenase (quinone), cytochrome c subunit
MGFRRAGLLAALALHAACSKQPLPAGAAPPVDRGAAIYMQNCLPCHREDGAGVPTVYPSLAGSAVVNGDPAQLARWVLNGTRPPSLPAGRYSTQMLSFAWLKDQDAAAVLSHIRASFGNRSAPVDAATVAAARQ